LSQIIKTNFLQTKKLFMKKFLLISLLFVFKQTVYASDSIPAKTIVYKAVAYTADGKYNRGYLVDINDSTLSLAAKPLPFGVDNLKDPQNHSYATLSYVQIKRKGSVGRGALYGALAGITVGVLSGLISGDDPHVPPEQDFFGLGEALRMTAGEKALAGGIGLGICGTITGAIIGAIAKKKFIINGHKEKFTDMKTSILDRVYGANTAR
jgi:hypothetical protein